MRSTTWTSKTSSAGCGTIVIASLESGLSNYNDRAGAARWQLRWAALIYDHASLSYQIWPDRLLTQILRAAGFGALPCLRRTAWPFLCRLTSSILWATARHEQAAVLLRPTVRPRRRGVGSLLPPSSGAAAGGGHSRGGGGSSSGGRLTPLQRWGSPDGHAGWGRPHIGLGQFFTPWPVAQLLAQMTADPETVRQRIAAAVAAAPPAQAALAAGVGLDGEAADAWLVAQVLPWVLPAIEPLRYAEPSCGSGVLILAAAATYPRWMSQLGLLHFYAIDLDPICALMCRVQCRLYGLAAQVECGNGLSAALPATVEGRILPARGSALAWAAGVVGTLPAPYPERAAAIDVQIAAAAIAAPPTEEPPGGSVGATPPAALPGCPRQAA